jgi:serine/threonine-protein kinase
VLKLAAGATAPVVVPFTGLREPDGVAVDKNGNVYVADQATQRMWMLAAGSRTQTELPSGHLGGPYGVAVDVDGTVYAH